MHTVSMAMLTVCLYAPVPAAKAQEKGPTAIERKLHGSWRSQSACGGTLTFRADGTYQHDGQGPGGDTSSGAWEVRWDALPPTLIITCKASTDPARAGAREAKLEGLNDDTLVLAYTKGAKAYFARVKTLGVGRTEIRQPAP